jgi:hypothetical protein
MFQTSPGLSDVGRRLRSRRCFACSAHFSLLQYDHGVRRDRRQCYARMAVHLFEVERLAPRREIYLSYCSPVRQDIDAKP